MSNVISRASCCVAFACCTVGLASAQTTSRVSVGSGGVQGNAESYDPAISANGRYVAFNSKASTLVPGDTNGAADIFVRDRATGTTTRVSVDAAGVQSNDDSLQLTISADGRFVAFASDATNLVPGDTNFRRDVFVHDRTTGMTSRVSVDSNGAPGDDMSMQPTLSADGRFVAFASDATNLVAGDANGRRDVFVHDRVSGITTRVSVSSNGAEGTGISSSPSISADGRRVAFGSSSSLVAGDTNGLYDVFVRDLSSGSTTCANVELDGLPGTHEARYAALSGNGRFVAFQSASPTLVPGGTSGMLHIFVRDLAAGKTTLVSADSSGAQGNFVSSFVSLSFRGRFVAFGSFANNLVPNDTNGMTKDMFVRDISAGTTTLVSANSLSAQSNDQSSQPVISLDGKHVAFYSEATNLVHGDTNGRMDVFVRDLP